MNVCIDLLHIKSKGLCSNELHIIFFGFFVERQPSFGLNIYLRERMSAINKLPIGIGVKFGIVGR
jgi:hypothetical protein